MDGSLTDTLKTASGCDSVPKKPCGKAHFTLGKVLSVTAHESDSGKESELSADGDGESKNHSDEIETSDDYGNVIEDSSGQFETFACPTKRSLKVSNFVLVKISVPGATKSKISGICFIGQIIKVISNVILEVSFMGTKHSANCSQNTFSGKDGINNCDFENIIRVFINPTVNQCEVHIFNFEQK